MIIGTSFVFVAGVRLWYFIVAFGGVLIFAYSMGFLHTYQKKRIFNLLNPEQDPLGAGYHILQSKIALGQVEF